MERATRPILLLLPALVSVWLLAGCGGGSSGGAVVQPPPVTVVRELARANTPFIEDGVPVELQVVLLKPEGDGPFPTLMFNHGSTGAGSDPAQFRLVYTAEALGQYFVARGWLVAFPQRRGRGTSDGLYDEGFNAERTAYSCDAALSLPGAERALDDLDAAVDWLRQRADVDPTRMVVGGTSRGGILSLAHAARRPDLYLGALNFVGGWLGEGCGDYLAVNRTLFEAGAAYPLATLWLYGENDSFYSLAHSRANHAAFIAAGGQGAFRVYRRAAGLNGHFLVNDPALWGADLNTYLEAL